MNVNTLKRSPKVSTKKFVSSKESRGQKWWNSLSAEEQQAYKDKKESEGKEIQELYKSTTEKVDALYKNISQLTKEDITGMLSKMARFHQYSAWNNLLILAQNEDATTVAGRKKWYEYGYKLKAGAKAIHLCAPIERVVFSKEISQAEYQMAHKNPSGIKSFQVKHGIRFQLQKSDFTQKEDGTYKLIVRRATAQFNDKAKVYDISDVEPIVKDGKDISRKLNDITAETKIPYKHIASFVAEIFDIEILQESMHARRGGFVRVGDASKIYINSNLSEEENAKTLIHELSHILLGHTDEDHRKSEVGSQEYKTSYAIDEIQAETLAYLLRELIGIKCNSEKYIYGYLNNAHLGDEILEKTLRKAMKVYDTHKSKFNPLLEAHETHK